MLRLITLATWVIAALTFGGCDSKLAPSPPTGGGGWVASSGQGGTGAGGGGGQGPGGAGGTRDGGPDSATCSFDTSQRPGLEGYGYASVVTSPAPAAYDGIAVVSQSTSAALVLTLSAPADGGAPDAGSTLEFSITGLTPMPLFTVGARLWLTKGEYDYQNGSLRSFSFALRDGQHGRVLLGAAEGGYAPLAWVVSVDQPTAACSEIEQTGCAPGATLTFGSATVTGDAPVVVQTDQVATVLLGGMPYDVRLFAAVETGATTITCTDYFGTSEVLIDLRAQDLATTSLSAGLPTAARDGG